MALDREYNRKLGAVARYYRVRSGLSTAQVAKKLGFQHANSVAHMESGRSALAIHLLVPLTSLYRVSVDELLSLTIPSGVAAADDYRCGFQRKWEGRCTDTWGHASDHVFEGDE